MMKLQDDNDPFWRTINLVANNGRVEAEVIDNVHHFAIILLHDGIRVTDVTAQAIRIPWVTCPGAIPLLRDLVGTLISDPGKTKPDQTQHCTHMLDLARLAIAQAHRGGRRRYESRTSYDPVQNIVVATLHRDGKLIVEWHLKNGRIISPGPFHGHETHGRSIWSDAVLANSDLREAGLIMRRATFVYRSRTYSQPRHSAADTAGMEGVCYSFQPERAAQAVRPANFKELS